MCGIFGYKGEGKTAEILLEGISKLDYRGYDSVGFATLDKKIHVKKGVGKIGVLKKKMDLSWLIGGMGISQTRWATHGKVTTANAHPHLSCDGNVAVVHNGIIENFEEIKVELIASGHVFRSETDSEVLAHLIEDALKKEKVLSKAVAGVLKGLQGRYAFVVMVKGYDEMIGVRNGSPLVVGVGDGESFVASDVHAFMKHTNKAVVLDDGDIL